MKNYTSVQALAVFIWAQDSFRTKVVKGKEKHISCTIECFVSHKVL